MDTASGPFTSYRIIFVTPVTVVTSVNQLKLLSTMEDVVIVGAGGFGREVCQWIEHANQEKARFAVRGFLDGDVSKHASVIHELPVLGDIDWLADHPGVGAVIAVGSPATKRRLVARLRPHVARFPTIVHPRAVLGRYVELGDGTIVCPDVIVTTDVRIGQFVTLNLDLTIGHDAVLGDYCTLAPGAHVSGYVTFGEGVEVGTGAVFVPSVSVGEWSVVGAGAVVSASLPANCTAVGIPAKPIKTRAAGWHA